MVEGGQIGEWWRSMASARVKPFPAWTADEEGPLIHDAVHLFDLFRLFGGEPISVVGNAIRRKQPFRVEDDSHAIFTFADGLSGVAMVNELTPADNRFGIEIQGTEGAIRSPATATAGGAALIALDRGINEPNPQSEWWQL